MLLKGAIITRARNCLLSCKLRNGQCLACVHPIRDALGSGGGGGGSTDCGLLGMCRSMGSHFHNSTDYNGVAFSSIFNRVTRMGSHFFGTESK